MVERGPLVYHPLIGKAMGQKSHQSFDVGFSRSFVRGLSESKDPFP